MRRPPDYMAEAYDDLAASRIRVSEDFTERKPSDVRFTCPVCGGRTNALKREAIEIKTDGEWRNYRPGRTYWLHPDRACISDIERGARREGDVSGE